MSLQARMSQADPRLYNVNRDVAHCFKSVMEEVSGRLEDGRWACVEALLKEKGVTLDRLGEACEAACRFVAGAVDVKKESMGACLARTGWAGLPDMAQVALCAHLGAVMLGYFWVGAHEATIQGVGPCNDMADLREAGRRAHGLLTMPRWRRWWWRLTTRLGRAWSALRGK